MPYHVGEKGSYGCEGYPAVDANGKVHGCHNTKEEAANQIYAINQSEGNIKADSCCPEELDKQAPCWDGYVQRGMTRTTLYMRLRVWKRLRATLLLLVPGLLLVGLLNLKKTGKLLELGPLWDGQELDS
jgi:hypothetical protein